MGEPLPHRSHSPLAHSINVHLSIFAVALATGTTMSGFFGMNLVSGLEEAQHAFPIVIAASTCTGAAIALFALNYMSGRTMQRRAEQRIKEIETLSSALSDMGALDYTVRFFGTCRFNPKPLGLQSFCLAAENICWQGNFRYQVGVS